MLAKAQLATTKESKSKLLWKKIQTGNKQVTLVGVKRITGSFSAKTSRIVIDLENNEMFKIKNSSKISNLFGKDKKIVIVKLDGNYEVKKGMKTSHFGQYRRIAKQNGDLVPEGCCLSIILNNSIKTIDLIAPDVDSCDKWANILEQHKKRMQYRKIQEEFQDFLTKEFNKADLDKNGRISYDELCKMLARLNIPCKESEIEQMWNIANFRKEAEESHKEEALDLDEFIVLYSNLSYNEVIHKEFLKISNGNEFLELKDLENMLLNIQEENKDGLRKFAMKIIENYEPLVKSKIKNNISINYILSSKGFTNMVYSIESDILDKTKTDEIFQDMNRPLTDYFFSTSHNTYLCEDQLRGPSTTETYRRYLSQGCRSVEIDIADGNDGEPIVTHKNTLTSKILLCDVVSTINEYAFVSSKYPVIISLENNCKDMDCQRKAAKIFIDIFGDKLITKPLNPDETRWPSPESLKEKIIIKGSSLPQPKEGETLEQLEAKACLPRELSDLVFYGKSKKLHALTIPDWNYNEMCSLEEGASLKFALNKEKYRKLSSKYMIKVYPMGLRVASSNYDPMPHWHCGAQMVAINFQQNKKRYQLYQAMFNRNARCGYILKPSYLLQESLEELNKNKKIKLQIRIMTAVEIIRDDNPLNLYVKIKKISPKKNSVGDIFKTRTVKSKSFNPNWEEKIDFTFNDAYSDLTFFRFKLGNQIGLGKSVTIGETMIPFNVMRMGFRSISLKNPQSEEIPTKILVRLLKY